MSRVHILASAESERIAAGEVIERPASVVRELVENAVDAAARRVDVDLVSGGIDRIEVADDGSGMERDDAVLALRRHATSKIRRLEDLSSLSTLGFRGEALPSIVAVSRFEMLTAAGSDGEATRLTVEGPGEPRIEPASRAQGTTIAVAELFFNTPARRKFLKSPRGEFSRVSDTLIPEMLAHPEVAFSLRHDGRQSLSAPGVGDLRQRLASLWSADLAERLLPFEAHAGELQVHGLVSGPDDSRASRRHWYLIVNGRPVRDRTLNHAVSHAMEGALPKGRFPALVLLLDLPSAEIDVNVHPAKSEVRFADGRRVHGVIVNALRHALGRSGYVASGPAAEAGSEVAVPAAGGVRASATAAWSVSETAGTLGGRPRSLFREPEPRAVEPVATPSTTGERPLVVLAQYRDCFIVCHDEEALFMVDQHVAHERILYEAIRRDLSQGEGERQALLFPQTVELGAGRGALAREAGGLLGRLGFDVEPFGDDAVLLRQVPAGLAEGQAVAAFRDVAEILADVDPGRPVESEVADRVEHRAAATIACHAAVKIHFPLTLEKMEYLVRELFRCEDPQTCPHGRRIVARWEHDDLLRTFGRL